MKTIRSPRIWIALAFGVAAGALAQHWPGAPRAVIACEDTPWHVAFSPDGTKLAILDRQAGLGMSASVLICDAASGEVLRRIDLGKRNYPHKVVFAPDGKTLGIADIGSVMLYDVESGAARGDFGGKDWSSNSNNYYGIELLAMPDGRWLYHDQADGRVHDVRTGALVSDLSKRWPQRNGLAHGGCVAAEMDAGKWVTVNAITGEKIATFDAPLKNTPFAKNTITLSADGTLAVYYSAKDEWVIHNSVTGSRAVMPPECDSRGLEDCVSADNRLYACVVFDWRGGWMSDLKRLLGEANYAAHVFDTATGKEIGPSYPWARHCFFAPDVKTLAIADNSNRVNLWDWPPPSRWLQLLAAAAIAMVLSLSVAALWRLRSARRERKGLLAKSTPSPPVLRGRGSG